MPFLCACETRLRNFAGGIKKKKGGSSQFVTKRVTSRERQAEKDAASKRFAGCERVMSYSFHRYTALARCTAKLQQLCRIRDVLPRADVAEDVEPSDAVVGRAEE